MEILKSFFDRKYAPAYLLIGGLLVFSGAFYYASRKNISPGETESEDGQELSVAGGQENVLESNTEITETPEVSISPTPSPKPTKTIQSPTTSPTSTPSPTQSPTPTPGNSQTTSSPSPSPTPTPELSITPSPTLTPAP